MTVGRTVTALAGFFVLLSLALGWDKSPVFHNVNWLWFTAFVGLNLFQSAFTGFCLSAILLRKMGMKD